jgi:hypothetical protein
MGGKWFKRRFDTTPLVTINENPGALSRGEGVLMPIGVVPPPRRHPIAKRGIIDWPANLAKLEATG